MYQQQLFNLLREFNRVSKQNHSFKNLLNDVEYRNQCMAAAHHENNSKLELIAKQIQSLEVDSKHLPQHDLLTHLRHNKLSRNKRLGLIVLALSGLLFIATSVVVVEEVKQQRASNPIHLID